jgi:hydrogenase maturation protease
MRNCLVIGIGNADRGDDAVGQMVAWRLRAEGAPGMRVVEHSGEPAGLIACLTGTEEAYLVDASMTGSPPGTISRFDVAATKLPRAAFECSTHGLGLVEAIDLARALGRMPHRCVVYAIEGRKYEVGDALSPEVVAAAEEVAHLIRAEVRRQEA